MLPRVVVEIGLKARAARGATLTRFGKRILAQKVWMSELSSGTRVVRPSYNTLFLVAALLLSGVIAFPRVRVWFDSGGMGLERNVVLTLHAVGIGKSQSVRGVHNR